MQKASHLPLVGRSPSVAAQQRRRAGGRIQAAARLPLIRSENALLSHGISFEGQALGRGNFKGAWAVAFALAAMIGVSSADGAPAAGQQDSAASLERYRLGAAQGNVA